MHNYYDTNEPAECLNRTKVGLKLKQYTISLHIWNSLNRTKVGLKCNTKTREKPHCNSFKSD